MEERGSGGPGQRVRGGGHAEQDKVKPHQRILKSTWFIPTVVVVVLVVFVLLSPRMAGSPPRLESITPTRGKPGDVMILSGQELRKPPGDLRGPYLGYLPDIAGLHGMDGYPHQPAHTG